MTKKKRYRKVVKYHWLLEGEKTLFYMGFVCIISFITHLLESPLLFALLFGIFGTAAIIASIPTREVYWEEIE